MSKKYIDNNTSEMAKEMLRLWIEEVKDMPMSDSARAKLRQLCFELTPTSKEGESLLSHEPKARNFKPSPLGETRFHRN